MNSLKISYGSKIFTYDPAKASKSIFLYNPIEGIRHTSYYDKKTSLILPGGTILDYYGHKLDFIPIIANGRVYRRDPVTGGPYYGPCKGVCEQAVFVTTEGCVGTSGKTYRSSLPDGYLMTLVNNTDKDLVVHMKSYNKQYKNCNYLIGLARPCGSVGGMIIGSNEGTEICWEWEPAKYGTITKKFDTECLLKGHCQYGMIRLTGVVVGLFDSVSLELYTILGKNYNVGYSYNEEVGTLNGYLTESVSISDDETWLIEISIFKNMNGATLNLSISSNIYRNATQTILATNYTTNETNSNSPLTAFGGKLDNVVGYASYIAGNDFSIFANFPIPDTN